MARIELVDLTKTFGSLAAVKNLSFVTILAGTVGFIIVSHFPD